MSVTPGSLLSAAGMARLDRRVIVNDEHRLVSWDWSGQRGLIKHDEPGLVIAVIMADGDDDDRAMLVLTSWGMGWDVVSELTWRAGE